MVYISKYLKFYKSDSIFVAYLFYKGQATKVYVENHNGILYQWGGPESEMASIIYFYL